MKKKRILEKKYFSNHEMVAKSKGKICDLKHYKFDESSPNLSFKAKYIKSKLKLCFENFTTIVVSDILENRP